MYIEHVALIVTDYDEAIDFFVGVVGFELVEDAPARTGEGGRAKRWVVVRPPGAITGVVLAKADGERQTRAVGDQFAGRVGLFLRVDDFDASLERLREAACGSSVSRARSPTGESSCSSTSPGTDGTYSDRDPARAEPVLQVQVRANSRRVRQAGRNALR
ncbi:MAG TPA: VOC family protein [Solirubrobacteraceae bacterium]|nr:VOC family protein [Solirubrobacteraceae bacterium]